MNKHKLFIKDAYDGKINGSLCQEWKEAIEKQYPEFKERTLEVGKWYWQKITGHETLILSNYNGKEGDCTQYGFTTKKTWSNNIGFYYDRVVREATDEEVKTALITEAKRRGFKKGLIHNCHDHSAKKEIKSNIFIMGWGERKYALHMQNTIGLIFNEGRWAKIIETITKEEAEKILGKTIMI